jgi:hypothetical protein
MKKTIAACALLAAGVQPAAGQLFEADSKKLGNLKMDIVLREIERRPLASVLEIRIKSIGSSVGSSFFILCSIRELAGIRGDYRHIVKLEERPKPGYMIIGFLRNPTDPIGELGDEFRSLKSPGDVIDLAPFAAICGQMK